jgi:hypothetical protein
MAGKAESNVVLRILYLLNLLYFLNFLNFSEAL